jgi:beta-hydroxylase
MKKIIFAGGLLLTGIGIYFLAQSGTGRCFLLWAGGIIFVILLAVRLFMPALLAIPYSLLLAVFARSTPYMNAEEHSLEQIDKVQGLFSKRDGIPWKTFFLKAFGNWVPSNCEKVPVTAALLRDMPEVQTAMFSILEPGKHIPGHRGIFKGILRYHLALIVPEEGNCFLEVKGQKYYWKEGEQIIFDDTFYHEAWNKCKETRVVLFIDILRDKSLPRWLRPVNRGAMNFFSRIGRVKKAVANAERMGRAGQDLKLD